MLLELNETGSNYTEKDIRDEVETFIVAVSIYFIIILKKGQIIIVNCITGK